MEPLVFLLLQLEASHVQRDRVWNNPNDDEDGNEDLPPCETLCTSLTEHHQFVRSIGCRDPDAVDDFEQGLRERDVGNGLQLEHTDSKFEIHRFVEWNLLSMEPLKTLDGQVQGNADEEWSDVEINIEKCFVDVR